VTLRGQKKECAARYRVPIFASENMQSASSRKYALLAFSTVFPAIAHMQKLKFCKQPEKVPHDSMSLGFHGRPHICPNQELACAAQGKFTWRLKR
jgi:hypothetical protein